MTLPLFLAAAIASAPQQEESPVFRISTEAIRVDVFVGENGRAVAGLRAEDFEIYDDGERQRIDSVAVEEVPLNVILALDTSLSVQGPTLAHLQEAASAFLGQLSPEDRAGLLTFSHHVTLRSELTFEADRLRLALRDVEARGGTAWHDALFASLELLEVVRDRPMVLLFTDGADTYSWLTEEQVPPLVQRSNAVVYAITREEPPEMTNLNTASGQRRHRERLRENRRRTGLLREVTDQSGGRLIETRSSDRLRDVFLEILAEMKTRYILTYTSRGPTRPGWHPLEVKVNRKGVDVHARRGYFFEPRKGSIAGRESRSSGENDRRRLKKKGG